MCFLLIFVLSLLADQFSKLCIQSFLNPGESVSIIPGFFRLTYVVNRGIFFGLLRINFSLVIFIHLLIVLFLFLLWRKLFFVNRRTSWGVGFSVGGLSGNLLDRIWKVGVIDFFDFGFWPVFNTADVFITVGVGIILWEILKFSPKK